MHTYHDVLPGFNAEHILHDGCEECEERGRDLRLGALDGRNFERAWERAVQWNTEGLDVSNAEVPILRVLWDVILHLERRGIPNAPCPGRTYDEQRAAIFGDKS